MRRLAATVLALGCLLTWNPPSARPAGPPGPSAADPVDFVREIQPVLERSCLRCHGPKKQEAELRLDSRAHALQGSLYGAVIVPGRGAESAIIERLLEPDPDSRMPHKDPPLPPAVIARIRAWIDQGADWPEGLVLDATRGRHWAYAKPARPSPPAVRDAGWVRNPIDAFVLAELERRDLGPAPEAPRETLIRRLHLDLIGLPPEPPDVDRFVRDRRPDAYERLVDRLLASPHFGERWAQPWLDLARYADTDGYSFDRPRWIWKYRDWVIDALNRDLPFDRFTVEQLAGDLLPDATVAQHVAAGFHRNTMANTENGVDREEARWERLVDRANTTATVWLGTTLGCARCHDHKYDPFTQREYYQFLAFFESAEEVDVPVVPAPHAQAAREILAEIARLDAVMQTRTPALRAAQLEWERQALTYGLADDVHALLATPHDRRAPDREELAWQIFVRFGGELAPTRNRLAELQRSLARLGVVPTLGFRERAGAGVPATHVRVKGSYARPGDRVLAGTPAALHPYPPRYPRNRLGLAMWLVDPENPLVARVTMNRLWDRHFGRPLVRSLEDFGRQGEAPTHPELLDWLATEFVRRGWSLKAMHRLVVTSATYRQSSRASSELRDRDPDNRWLGRAPRLRLDAETLRDTMLAAAGLLSRRIGGPSVFPPQPDASGFVPNTKETVEWVASRGEARYRRGLYTFWRRTAPFPAFAALDAPSRESSVLARPRTNTPIQALATLNDPAFFEAARGLAARVLREAGPDAARRATLAFRLCVARRPEPGELALLVGAYRREQAHYAKDLPAARALVGDDLPAAGGATLPELAAWTVVANVLLNLDETLTRE